VLVTTKGVLALALLVTRVLANDHDIAVTANDLALVADLLDAGVNLHNLFLVAVIVLLCWLINGFPSFRRAVGRYFPATTARRIPRRDLLVAIDDPATGQVVGAQLNDHAVLREDADVVLTHLARNVGKNSVAVGQLNAEHCVGQSFDYSALNLDDTVFFGHGLFVAKSSSCWSCVVKNVCAVHTGGTAKAGLKHQRSSLGYELDFHQPEIQIFGVSFATKGCAW
jgi:hypothetical protein